MRAPSAIAITLDSPRSWLTSRGRFFAKSRYGLRDAPHYHGRIERTGCNQAVAFDELVSKTATVETSIVDTQGKSGIDIKTVEDAIRLVEASKLTHIKVGLSDVDGILRGKYLRKDKFVCALRSGFAFCSVVLGWDADDQMYDNASYTGWHGLPGCAGPHHSAELPPAAAGNHERRTDAVLPGGVRRRCRGHLPARRPAPGDQARRRPGLRRVFGAGIRVLRVRGNASQRARKELPEPQELDARELRLFDPAQHGEQRFLSRPHRHDRDHGHADRGTAHRDGAGRAGGRAGGRRSLGDGRQGHAVQVLHQGPGPAQRPDGHVHGEVVAQRARPERPHPHVAARAGIREVGVPR